MKKLVLIVLSIFIIVSAGSVCFAANGDSTAAQTTDIIDGQTAGGAAYTEQPSNVVDIQDGQVPGGSAKDSAQTTNIKDQEIPKALPKTGGIPAEAFYGAGGLMIIGALVLSMKKSKA